MQDQPRKRIKVMPVTPEDKPTGVSLSAKSIEAEVCFYYGYTLDYVETLGVRRLNKLLRAARRIEAHRNYNLTRIIGSMNNQDALNDLLTEYSEIISGR